MSEELQEQQRRSYVTFERSARGVITPKVSVVMGDSDPDALDQILKQSMRVFTEALNFAEENGAKP